MQIKKSAFVETWQSKLNCTYAHFYTYQLDLVTISVGRENGTTQQWLVVDSITIVFQFAGCQVNASHNVSVDRENVTKKCDLYGLYIDSMSAINQFIIAHTKSVICENIPMCCDCAS